MQTMKAMKTLSWAFGALLITSMAGCADRLIETRVGAEAVSTAEASQVSKCQSKGNTTVGVMSSLAFYTRSADSVEENLLKLARNAAIDAGGDTLVKGNSTEYGKREFLIYKCR
jgi:pectin methylesterase-like acyl-CoA thioesterase